MAYKKKKNRTRAEQIDDALSNVLVLAQTSDYYKTVDDGPDLYMIEQIVKAVIREEKVNEGELDKEVVVAKFATTTKHGARKGKNTCHRNKC